MPGSFPKRRFVPPELDPGQWPQLEPLYQALLDRPIGSADELEQWLHDLSELTAVVSEYGARRRIDHACHTDDPAIEKAFLHYVEEIWPRIQPLSFQLQRKLLESPHRSALDAQRYSLLLRHWQAEVELFRPENVPIQAELTKLASRYDKIIGAMTVQFRGESYTLQQLARFLEEPDRATRQEAWELSANRRLADRDAIDDLFEQMLQKRQQVAQNADMDDYRAYVWKDYARFDYTPEDCLRFAEAIERVCVPLVERLDQQRRQQMGLEALRPWDLSVDVHGRPPLRPFDADNPADLVAKTTAIFDRLDPSLAQTFARLQMGRNLDLASRPGKRAGGFQSSLEESGEPFIFMNAAGLQRDVETLLHEGGHAFHFLWAHQHQPLVFLRHAPLEFCEVASMAMELMGGHHFDLLYDDPSQQARARRDLLEGIVRFFPWMAIIDTFQHWLYTHPGHSRDDRREQWLSLLDRFQSSVVDWSGYEEARAAMWQRQLHLFHRPFYYVEYGIAQLGALQLWSRFRQDRAGALRDYRAALSLGGSRPLPELFAAAGLRFRFDQAVLEPLMHGLWDELESLPDAVTV